MDFFASAWDVLSTAFVFAVGLVFVVNVAKKFKCNWRRALFLYFWHTLFCVFYVNYVILFGGDAIAYYEKSISLNIDFSFGTFAVIYLTRLFSYYLELSFLAVFFVFNILGCVGLLAFDASLRHASSAKSKMVRFLANILVFLPSVSFWSSAIGKDSISFMAASLSLWAAIEFNRRIRLMIFSTVLMLIVRPHMAGLMIIALAVSVIFRGKISFVKKSALVFASVSAMAVAVPFALQYAGMSGTYDVIDFENYFDERQSYNQDGGGGIDISSMSLPMQLFTYMFRPLPFEAHSLTALAASFENIVLFVVFVFGILGLFDYRKNRKSNGGQNKLFMWIYSILGWVILALTTANLGISVRQKWMFVPILVFLLISMMAKRKDKNGENNRLSLPLYDSFPQQK